MYSDYYAIKQLPWISAKLLYVMLHLASQLEVTYTDPRVARLAYQVRTDQIVASTGKPQSSVNLPHTYPAFDSLLSSPEAPLAS
jgi:hypothetical protein